LVQALRQFRHAVEDFGHAILSALYVELLDFLPDGRHGLLGFVGELSEFGRELGELIEALAHFGFHAIDRFRRFFEKGMGVFEHHIDILGDGGQFSFFEALESLTDHVADFGNAVEKAFHARADCRDKGGPRRDLAVGRQDRGVQSTAAQLDGQHARGETKQDGPPLDAFAQAYLVRGDHDIHVGVAVIRHVDVFDGTHRHAEVLDRRAVAEAEHGFLKLDPVGDSDLTFVS